MRGKIHHSGIGAVRPYSLIEMLMVIAIVAILVGIGAGGYAVGRRWLAQSTTEALLAKIKMALESYKNDKGYYPLPQIAPSTIEADVPFFKLDVNVKDFPSGSGEHLQPRNNMNNFIDYSKIQMDQSLKIPGSCTLYYVKDGWNAPVDGAGWPFGPNVPFGPIKYRCPGLINKTSFDLYSAGHDRKFATNPETNTEDDIYAK